jgi:hypothetical protein
VLGAIQAFAGLAMLGGSRGALERPPHDRGRALLANVPDVLQEDWTTVARSLSKLMSARRALPGELPITACGIDHDGSRLVLGTDRGRAFVIDTRSGDAIGEYELEFDGDVVEGCVVRDDGRRALVWTQAENGPHRAHVLDLGVSGCVLRSLARAQDYGQPIFAAGGFCPGGRDVVLLHDYDIVVWNIEDGSHVSIPLPDVDEGYWTIRGDAGLSFGAPGVFAFTSATGVGVVDVARRSVTRWLPAPRDACVLHLVRMLGDRIVTVSGPPSFSNPPQTEWELTHHVLSGEDRLTRRQPLPARAVWLSPSGEELLCVGSKGELVRVQVPAGVEQVAAGVESLGSLPEPRVLAVSGDGGMLVCGAYWAHTAIPRVTCVRLTQSPFFQEHYRP